MHALLSRTKMLYNNPIATPPVLANKPSFLDNVLTDAIAFQSIVRTLQLSCGWILFIQLIGYVNIFMTLL